MGALISFIFKVTIPFAKVVAVLLPPLLLSVIVLYLLSRSIKEPFFRSEAVGHGLVFGIVGLAVAYLFISRDTTFSDILPHTIVVITILFQLLGRTLERAQVPLKSRATMVAIATGAFMFLFGVLYFENLLGNKVLIISGTPQ